MGQECKTVREGLARLRALFGSIPLLSISPLDPTEENFKLHPDRVVLYLVSMQASNIANSPDPAEALSAAVAYIFEALLNFDSSRGVFEHYANFIACNACITAWRRQATWIRKTRPLEEEYEYQGMRE